MVMGARGGNKRVFEVAQWFDEKTVSRKYTFRDTKDLDENRWFLDPSGSKNPGTDKSSNPEELGLNL